MGSRWLTALWLVAALAAPARADKNPTSPYDVNAPFDAPFLGLGLAIWVTPTLTMSHQIEGPTCDAPSTPGAACDPSTINFIDRHFIYDNSGARLAANLMYAAIIPLYFTVEMVDYGLHHWKPFFSDLVVFAEALSWGGALDEIFRRAVRRPRPFLYIAGAQPDQRDNAEATFSYYSGHVSAMFTITSFLTYTWWLRHPGSRWTWLIMAAGATVGIVEGLLRIAGGDHFPTDVVTGIIAGTNVGLLIPYLRKKRAIGPFSSLMVSASTGGDQTMFALGGRF